MGNSVDLDYPEHIEVETEEPQSKKRPFYSIANLRLNLEAATAGRTWELLPIGFRRNTNGNTYPLPTRRMELQKLASIYIPPNAEDCGCIYLRRVIKKWKVLQGRSQNTMLRMGRVEGRVEASHENFQTKLRHLRMEAEKARDSVLEEAEKAIASLTELFALGRKGLEGQMRAHLENTEWQGEHIDAHAFRDCFRMVSQSVARLGLPSEERKRAQEAIFEETAAAIRDSQEAIALAPSNEQETENPAPSRDEVILAASKVH